VTEKDPMRMEGTLRITGRARGVDDDGRILSARVHRREVVGSLGADVVEAQRAWAWAWAVDREDVLQIRQIGADPVDLLRSLGIRDHRAGAAVPESKRERFRSEE
jgi:hypothetical protein